LLWEEQAFLDCLITKKPARNGPLDLSTMFNGSTPAYRHKVYLNRVQVLPGAFQDIAQWW